MTDRYGTLWVGTKGDGLIRIPDYQKEIDLKLFQFIHLKENGL